EGDGADLHADALGAPSRRGGSQHVRRQRRGNSGRGGGADEFAAISICVHKSRADLVLIKATGNLCSGKLGPNGNRSGRDRAARGGGWTHRDSNQRNKLAGFQPSAQEQMRCFRIVSGCSPAYGLSKGPTRMISQVRPYCELGRKAFLVNNSWGESMKIP